MAHDIAGDRRIDPRIKALLELGTEVTPPPATTREEMLAAANTPEAIEAVEIFRSIMDLCDTEEAAPSAGLTVSMESITSAPDGNSINLQIIRPEGDAVVPCVYYIHGGGMTNLSCLDGMYRGWGKLIAANGVAVVMVDFRNAISPSSVPEVAPYPAGLNDCISGFRWTVEHAGGLHIDPARIVIAGESGGGNLTLASGLRLLRDGEIGKVKGLYALCPYIAGSWPQDRLPSSVENNGILLNLHDIVRGRRLRDRGLRGWRSPGLAPVRHRRRCDRAAARGDQRERVRPTARRGDRVLPTAPRGRRPGPLPPNRWAPCTGPRSSSSPARM